MADDDATQQAPSDAPAATTEIDSAPTTADGPLAYSDHTSSMPVIEYRASRVRPVWIVALVLAAASAVAAATFFLGRTTARLESGDTTAIDAPTVVPVQGPTAVSPPSAVAVPPPSTVTVIAPATPTSTASTLSDDEKFLALLRMDGIGAPNPRAAIDQAHGMCDYLTANGMTQYEGVKMLQAQGWEFERATKVLSVAVVVYCPNLP